MKLWLVDSWSFYQGTMTVEAIRLCCFEEEICFNNEAMKKMKSLRILHIVATNTNFFASRPSSNHHDDSIEYLSNNLRWLVWNAFSWKSLPENFKPEKLVHLQLRGSSLHYLWKETEVPFYLSYFLRKRVNILNFAIWNWYIFCLKKWYIYYVV